VIRNSQPPGAVIMVDGNRLGAAPQTATLKAGQHTIEAKQAGYADYRDTVQVRAGEQTVLNVVLMATPRESPPAVPVSTAPVEQPRQAFEPEMVAIPGGCFQMGSPASEEGRSSDERQHQVCLKGFEMGRYEVTQGQWQSVTGDNPSRFSDCADCPVDLVSWEDVQDYLRKLTSQTGKKYRLPTEAEWEYACRGGVVGQTYCGGDSPDRVAWYKGNSSNKTHPVGQKAANGFGLYDMSGNVWEWTCSTYDKKYGGAEKECSENSASNPALRGGSWFKPPAVVRSAIRTSHVSIERSSDIGFRLARSL